MGCGGSKEDADDGQGHHGIQIGAPTEVNIHIPRNRADDHGQPIRPITHDMDRASLEYALQLMARFMNSRGLHATAITVGGAVNCMLLQSRATTHDIDIFSAYQDAQTRIVLDEAMQYAVQHSPVPLGTDWFNTETEMWMSPTIKKYLTDRSVRQNLVVFQQPGLTLLAAPWGYAFSAKVQRFVTRSDQARAYDLGDAVQYLHQAVKANGNQPIRLATIEDWARKYNHTTSRTFLFETINTEYQRLHRRNGIVR